MGTSKSSIGAGNGVRLVPAWLDVPDTPPTSPSIVPLPPVDGINHPLVPALGPILTTALPGRFKDARHDLGAFIRSGEQTKLQRGIGSYVGKGYRGASTTSARMGQATTSAAKAYGLLGLLASGTATLAELGFDPATLAGAAIDDIIGVLVDAICPNNTALDDAAGRSAVNEAISGVLEETPGLDPLALPPEYIREIWIRSLAYHVFEDLMLDVGGALQTAASGDPQLFNDRCLEIRDFICERYREQLESREANGQFLNSTTANSLARDVQSSVMHVFEGWME